VSLACIILQSGTSYYHVGGREALSKSIGNQENFYTELLHQPFHTNNYAVQVSKAKKSSNKFLNFDHVRHTRPRHNLHLNASKEDLYIFVRLNGQTNI